MCFLVTNASDVVACNLHSPAFAKTFLLIPGVTQQMDGRESCQAMASAHLKMTRRIACFACARGRAERASVVTVLQSKTVRDGMKRADR